MRHSLVGHLLGSVPPRLATFNEVLQCIKTTILFAIILQRKNPFFEERVHYVIATLDIGANLEIPLDLILFLSVHVIDLMRHEDFWDAQLMTKIRPRVNSRCNLLLSKGAKRTIPNFSMFTNVRTNRLNAFYTLGQFILSPRDYQYKPCYLIAKPEPNIFYS